MGNEIKPWVTGSDVVYDSAPHIRQRFSCVRAWGFGGSDFWHDVFAPFVEVRDFGGFDDFDNCA
jgi:hypothetical protein